MTLPACLVVPKGQGIYDAGYVDRGVASWYGGYFHGRPTASGQIYDQYKMTAAHRLLPLGTVVRVTNAGNQREAIVVVNDRGPYIRGRIIDLSYAAAKHLGGLEAGTLPVVIEVVQQSAQCVNFLRTLVDNIGAGERVCGRTGRPLSSLEGRPLR